MKRMIHQEEIRILKYMCQMLVPSVKLEKHSLLDFKVEDRLQHTNSGGLQYTTLNNSHPAKKINKKPQK
jgi:hypothetical protein